MAVDATKVIPTRGDFGVACGGPTSQFPYAAYVDVGGWWRIVHLPGTTSTPVDLRTGREEGALIGQGPHRVELECVGEGERLSLTLTVNGVELARATGRRGTAFGQGPGVVALAFRTRIEVLFDNFGVAYS